MEKARVEDYIRSIPDFPQKGVVFRDITTVLQDADGLHMAIDEMQKRLEGLEFDKIAGLESRGFIFGMPIAYNLHKPFVLIRKKGKLPCETVQATYHLEYGTATIEMHRDAIKPGQRVLIVDDLVATGGTIRAMIDLVERCGGVVAGVLVLMELKGLNGREFLKGYRLDSAIAYEGK
jgi:adenine phosphoribosyltransferase